MAEEIAQEVIAEDTGVEEAAVEEVAAEITEESQDEQEEIQEEAVAEQPQKIEVDLSDLYEGSAEQPSRQVQPDYEGLIEDIVSKVTERLRPQPQVQHQDAFGEQDGGPLDSDQITQNVLNQVERKRQAEKAIFDNIQQSEFVLKKYVEKIKKAGVDLDNNPALQNSANLLFKQMKLDKAARIGRQVVNPVTGQIDPVLTPKETAEVLADHWKVFSETYLAGQSFAVPTKATQNLSPANKAITDPGHQQKPAPDPVALLREKRESGNLTREDVIAAMFTKSSQKK